MLDILNNRGVRKVQEKNNFSQEKSKFICKRNFVTPHPITQYLKFNILLFYNQNFFLVIIPIIFSLQYFSFFNNTSSYSEFKIFSPLIFPDFFRLLYYTLIASPRPSRAVLNLNFDSEWTMIVFPPDSSIYGTLRKQRNNRPCSQKLLIFLFRNFIRTIDNE